MPRKPVQAIRVDQRGKPYWRVIIPRELSGGKRKTRWFSKKVDAVAFASRLESDRVAFRDGFAKIGLEHQSRIMRALEKAGGLEELETAVEEYRARKPKIPVKLDQCVKEFLEVKRSANKAKTYVDLLRFATARFLVGRFDRLVSSVTTTEIESWLHGNGWEPETKKGYLKSLRTLFEFARKKGYCALNPAENVERPVSIDKPPCILTVEECERLMRAAEAYDPGLVPYLALCLFGGLRPWEARAIEASEVKPGHVEVKATKSKARRRRLVTLNETLAAWLALGGDYQPINLKRRLLKVRERSRLKDDPDRTPLPWGHDILRHSFVSYHYAIHGAASTAREAGHSEAVLFAHYRELVTRADAEMFFAIRPRAT